jgi:HAD superfamily hydrolase (TIGR01484 family)
MMTQWKESIIAIDLDGTLFKNLVQPLNWYRDYSTLCELKRQSARLVAITARAYWDLWPVKLWFPNIFEIIVSYNGGLIVDDSGHTLSATVFDEVQLSSIFKFCYENTYDYKAFGKHGAVQTYKDSFFRMRNSRLGSLKDFNEPVFMVTIKGNGLRIKETDIPNCEVHVDNSETCYITPQGINKGTALISLLGLFEKSKRIISVGDSPLDEPMFRVSNFSITINRTNFEGNFTEVNRITASNVANGISILSKMIS